MSEELTAYELAIGALYMAIKRIEEEADLYDIWHVVGWPSTQRASELRIKIMAAIVFFQGKKEGLK